MKQRQIVSAILASALIFTGAATVLPGTSVTALAAKKKAKTKTVYVVDTLKTSGGVTTKNTYNKKAQITKSVSTSSSKNTSSDNNTTTTTTYKYDKKGYLVSEVQTEVNVQTSYDTDKTTGKTRKDAIGTVTTTTTTTTDYTNDKKGVATKAVATTTTVKTGQTVSTYVERLIDSDIKEVKDANGNISYVAGYNDYDVNGNRDNENDHTLANAYFYRNAGTDDINQARQTVTSTTTYTDNGNGSYTETRNSVTSKPNFSTTENTLYYVYPTNEYGDRIDGNAIPVTKNDDTYVDASGRTYDNYDFTRHGDTTVKVDPNAANTQTSEDTQTNIYDKKTVATTVFTNKNGRHTKAVITTVNTSKNNYSDKNSRKNPAAGTDDELSSESSYSRSDESTSTTTTTTTYSYNKKGKVTKEVYSNDGVENSVEISKGGDSSYQYTTNRENGVTSTVQGTNTGSTITTTTIANGKKTVSTSNGASGWTYSEVYSDGSRNSNRSTYTVYYANGGSRNDFTYSEKDKDGSNSGSNTSYYLTNDRKSYVSINKYSYTPAVPNEWYSGETNEDSTYNDGKHSYYGYNDPEQTYSFTDDPTAYRTAAEVSAAATNAIKALEASGTTYVETKESAVNAEPSTYTRTYTYDKKGQLKSMKKTGSDTEEINTLDETFGNTIYTPDPIDGNLDNTLKQINVNNYTYNFTYDTTVSHGQPVKQVEMSTRSYNGSSSTGYDVSRTTSTLKAIKVK